MSIKDKYSFGEFIDAFREAGRGDYYSYGGLETIFDMLDDFDWIEEIDPVAICCDFTEYDTPLETAEELGVSVYDLMYKPDFEWNDAAVRAVCDKYEMEPEDFFSEDYFDWDDDFVIDYCNFAGVKMADFMSTGKNVYDDDVWELIMDSGHFNDARMTSSGTLIVCE